MWFIRTTKVGTDAFRQLASRKQPIEFHNVALGMHPFGFNRVKPRALGRQQERQDPHAVARLLDRSVVSTDPGAHGLALMPGGVIPDQQPMGLALLKQALAAPVQELGSDGADGPSGHEAQPDLRAVRVLRGPLLPENPRRRPGLWDPGRLCARLALPTVRGGPDFARHTPEAGQSGSQLTSSAKPMAQLGCWLAQAIKRSRAFF
jgi:hypothetical protein